MFPSCLCNQANIQMNSYYWYHGTINLNFQLWTSAHGNVFRPVAVQWESLPGAYNLRSLSRYFHLRLNHQTANVSNCAHSCSYKPRKSEKRADEHWYSDNEKIQMITVRFLKRRRELSCVNCYEFRLRIRRRNTTNAAQVIETYYVMDYRVKTLRITHTIISIG
jgi:hypothetical protein